ncbi:arsenical-resistance protein [Stagnimonas aquatica]|uniref:Arsenical-resistance protein n=1 Tax=Stagnimonas aquatica TaxID=2689987 RepID=A0A3N0VKB1_9GAMM|nr:ACR3 family arsenite efflux transporter [Stagnimonas aquatica]ROH93206.1 arsenical-resistance protein [Stagnimonas aquatica]
MNLFERGLTLWVALCMLAGTLLGQWLPGAFAAIGQLELAQVNLPVGALIWLMIVPMLARVDFSSLGQLRRHWRGFGVTLAVNWLLKPLLMAALAGLFIRHWFADWLPADQRDSYVAGLILLAAAPCTAMVFVWSRLVGGDANYTLSQVALNDALMLLLFAPLVALLLGVAAVPVPWATLLLSVLLYILLPLALAQALRRHWRRRGPAELERQLARLGPASMLALLATLVLLFGFQGKALLAQPLTVVLLALPISLQVAISSATAYLANRALGEPHAIAGPSCLIGASNFFELAVAAAIALYGLHSGAALATVVGVLVEVPAMLAVVAVVNRSRNWYRRAELPGN